MRSDDSEQSGSDEGSEESWIGYSSEDDMNDPVFVQNRLHEEASNPITAEQEDTLNKLRQKMDNSKVRHVNN